MTLEQTPQGPQLTIGALIAALDELPGGMTLNLAGAGNAQSLMLLRHRANSNGVAIRAVPERITSMTVNRFRVMLTEHASQYATKLNPNPARMGWPLWAADGDSLAFRVVTGVDVIKGAAYLRWFDVAPVHGPALQRITDVEVLRRNAELSDRDEPNLDPTSGSNRWMLEQIPKERDRTRVRLAKSRSELAKLTLEIAALEAESARYDYTLGITDVNPGRAGLL